MSFVLERENRRETERNTVIKKLIAEIHPLMLEIFGDRVQQSDSKVFEVLPGIPNKNLTVPLCSKIRQLLAALHDDGDWNNPESQKIMTEQAMRKVGVQIGEGETVGDETTIEFSGNDKYGLTYGPGMAYDMIPPAQLEREEERLYYAWYIKLYSVYLQNDPARMREIIARLNEASLPLSPSIQKWSYDQIKKA